MDKKIDREEGVRMFEEASRFDDLAETREDFACVEESYWTALLKLEGSPDAEHGRICRSIVDRLARFLEAEGRHEQAKDLRRRKSRSS